MLMHASNPSTGKAEAEGPRVQGQFRLHNKFHASLGHRVREAQSSNFPTPKESENTVLLMFLFIIYSSILNLFFKQLCEETIRASEIAQRVKALARQALVS